MAVFENIYLLSPGPYLDCVFEDFATSVEGLECIAQDHYSWLDEETLTIEVDLPGKRVIVTEDGYIMAECVIHTINRSLGDKGYLDAE